jgi:hypothetical protein
MSEIDDPSPGWRRDDRPASSRDLVTRRGWVAQVAEAALRLMA